MTTRIQIWSDAETGRIEGTARKILAALSELSLAGEILLSAIPFSLVEGKKPVIHIKGLACYVNLIIRCLEPLGIKVVPIYA